MMADNNPGNSKDRNEKKKKSLWIIPLVLGAGVTAAGLLYHTGVIAGKKPEKPVENTYNTYIHQDNYFIRDSIIVLGDLNATPVPKETPKPREAKETPRRVEDRVLEDRARDQPAYDGTPIQLGIDVIVSGEYRGAESSVIVTVDPSVVEKGYVIKSLGRKVGADTVYGTPYTGADRTGTNYLFTGIVPKVDENPTLSLTAILEREETVKGEKVKKTYTDDQDLTVTARRYFSVHDIEGAYQVKTEHKDVHIIKIFGTTLEDMVYERGGRAGLLTDPKDGPVFSKKYLKPDKDVIIEAYFLEDNGSLRLLDRRRF